MKGRFETNENNEPLLMDVILMMETFMPIATKVDPFSNYLDYMFEEMLSIPISVFKSLMTKCCCTMNYMRKCLIPPKQTVDRLIKKFTD